VLLGEDDATAARGGGLAAFEAASASAIYLVSALCHANASEKEAPVNTASVIKNLTIPGTRLCRRWI
jgi:hypothetical protein